MGKPVPEMMKEATSALNVTVDIHSTVPLIGLLQLLHDPCIILVLFLIFSDVPQSYVDK